MDSPTIWKYSRRLAFTGLPTVSKMVGNICNHFKNQLVKVGETWLIDQLKHIPIIVKTVVKTIGSPTVF